MPVQLDDEGRPVVWSDDDRVEGQDIPLPPEPAPDHRWNGEEWVNEPVPETDMSNMTPREVLDALGDPDSGLRDRDAVVYLLRRETGAQGNERGA